jgi:hypothetical protein
VCSGIDLVGPSTCDDKGTCVAPTASKCGQYTCDPAAAACRTSCAVNEDCSPGFTCIGGVCGQGARCNDDKTSSIAKSGESESCAPFLCGADGKCASTCNASDECAAGALCDTATARCVASAGSSDDGGGCTYGDRAPGEGFAMALLAALALGSAARRRMPR